MNSSVKFVLMARDPPIKVWRHFCFQVSQKELKEVLRRQWSQLSDKRRLKWISKALELQKDYEVLN